MSVNNDNGNGAPSGATVSKTDVGEISTERDVEFDGRMTSERMNLVEMSNPVYDLGDFFQRDVLLSTGVMTTSDTALTNLLGNYLPYTLYLANTAVLAKTKYFGLIRGTFKVKIVCTFPSNAYGHYLFNAVPEGGQLPPTASAMAYYSEQGGAAVDTPYSATQNVHGWIDVSKSNTVELTLPFVYPTDGIVLTNNLSYLQTGDPWRLGLWAVAPIMNAVNTSTISGTYKIFGSWDTDMVLSMPVLQAKSKKFGGGSKMAEIGNTINDFKESKTISITSKKIAAGAASLGAMVPMLAPLAGPIAAGAAAVAGVAEWLGFTKESKPADPMPVVQRRLNNMSTVDGFDSSDVAGLYNSNTTTIDPTIGGGTSEDEASFASLLARWTIVDTFQWSTATTAGTFIRSFPVTPFHCTNLLGAYYPGTDGYVGMPMRYWRGGKEYILIVVGSPYHRGALQVLWDQNPTQTATTDTTNILANFIVDAASEKTIKFNVGYAQPVGALYNTGLMTSAAHATALPGYNCNGMVYIRVNQQLQAVGGTAPVTCILLSRAASDMRFGVPAVTSKFVSDTSSLVNGMNMTAMLQALGDEEDEDEVEFELYGGSGESYPTSSVLFGEDFASVRPLVQRFSRIGTIALNTTTATGMVAPHFYPAPSHVGDGGSYVDNWSGGDTDRPLWTWFGHYAALFVGVRGSTRYKTLGMSSTGTGVQALPFSAIPIEDQDVALLNRDTFTGGTIATVQGFGLMQEYINASDEMNTEVIVPNYMGYKMALYRFLFNAAYTTADLVRSGYRRDMISFAPTNGATAGHVHVYQAGGPDTSLIQFRRVPAVIAAGF
jgi:hypothetical protein